MPSEEIVIRKYLPQDRIDVHRICCETADMGRPMESFFSDREFFSDMVISYYTDFEPGSLWVALIDNKVVGYLSGCLDTKRYTKIMKAKIAPCLFLKLFTRGTLFRLKTLKLLISVIKSILVGGLKRGMSLEDYPAHLHIDILDGFRGKNIGSCLMDKFINQAKEAKVNGIHLSVREDNEKSRKFFERQGFSFFARYPVFMPKNNSYYLGATVVMVRKL